MALESNLGTSAAIGLTAADDWIEDPFRVRDRLAAESYRTFREKGIDHLRVAAEHAHEVPWVMRGPLVALAVMSVTAGFMWMNGFFRFFGSEAHFEFGFVAIIPFAGIVAAYLLYVRGKPAPDALAKRFEPAYVLLKHRYFVDEAYDWLIDNLVMKVSAGIAWFDRHVVDGAVNGVAWMTNRSGSRLRYLQTGQVQNYALVIFGGVIVLLMLARMAGAR